ncbi:cold shock domain-containing protein CG9705-like [Pollicipes pollicipes]|uniref:cold shock domain-containing protein CG9705-like n=1 Tax=Pollicipes pollicipes TaxID=41117 RepID=UPI001884A68B|nr:cold shock domain-containing protein CG9705-like [Pollicipes pollicipes]XP_037074694.1 cold shock domain-containing protein CG9705-like [Pollicipes pollicipes]
MEEGKLSPVLDGHPSLRMPSPLITRRTRTQSTSDRGMRNPDQSGTIVSFCRTKGHGFIRPDEPRPGEPLIFVHVSDVEGEYIPVKEDRVTFRLCQIPPKMERSQAIHVRIINFCHTKHHKWNDPPSAEEKTEDSATFVN